jgi:hypothetical protein
MQMELYYIIIIGYIWILMAEKLTSSAFVYHMVQQRSLFDRPTVLRGLHRKLPPAARF